MFLLQQMFVPDVEPWREWDMHQTSQQEEGEQRVSVTFTLTFGQKLAQALVITGTEAEKHEKQSRTYHNPPS